MYTAMQEITFSAKVKNIGCCSPMTEYHA